MVTAFVLPEIMADDNMTLLLLAFVKRTGTTNILAQKKLFDSGTDIQTL